MAMGRPMLRDVKTRLGKEIRRARKALNLTLDDLSCKSGLSLSTIQAIETGSIALPGRDKLRKLADALQPETDYSLLAVLAYEEEPDAVPQPAGVTT